MFWTKDGKLITDGDGRPIDCPTCPCKTCEQSLLGNENIIESRIMARRPTLSITAYDPVSQEYSLYYRGSGNIMVFGESRFFPYREGVSHYFEARILLASAFIGCLNDEDYSPSRVIYTICRPGYTTPRGWPFDSHDEYNGLAIARGYFGSESFGYRETTEPPSVTFLAEKNIVQTFSPANNCYVDTIAESDVKDSLAAAFANAVPANSIVEASATVSFSYHGSGDLLYYDDYRGGNRTPYTIHVLCCAIATYPSGRVVVHYIPLGQYLKSNYGSYELNAAYMMFYANINSIWSDQDRDLLVFE